MKMTAIKPIYLNRDVVLAGQQFDTADQHGRELIKKGYAEAVPEPAQPTVQTDVPTAGAEAETPALTTGTQTEAPAPDGTASVADADASAPAEPPAPAADATTKAKTK
jgi:hypothetical protein